jgi:DNA-binding NtrC family response regulator
MRNILLLDRDDTERAVVTAMLVKLGCKVTAVKNIKSLFNKFKRDKYILVIFDERFEDNEIDEFTSRLREIDLGTPLALMGVMGVEFYEKKYANSDIDFVFVKPFWLVELGELVEEAMELSERLRLQRM